MPEKSYNFLYLCTGNSTRSVIAEAILNREGGGRFRAFSAGSAAQAAPHPYAPDVLAGRNHDTRFARAKNWDKFAGSGLPEMDFVFTVCDRAKPTHRVARQAGASTRPGRDREQGRGGRLNL